MKNSNIGQARKIIKEATRHPNIDRPCMHYHNGRCDLGHNWKCVTDGTVCGDYEC